MSTGVTMLIWVSAGECDGGGDDGDNCGDDDGCDGECDDGGDDDGCGGDVQR